MCVCVCGVCVSVCGMHKYVHVQAPTHTTSIEHLDDVLLKAKASQMFKDMSESKQSRVRVFFWVDQMLVPLIAMTYCFGMMIAAARYGADLSDEFMTEILLMMGFMLIVFAGAFYDMWKSAEMAYASHRHYKRSLKEWISDMFSCLHYVEEKQTYLEQHQRSWNRLNPQASAGGGGRPESESSQDDVGINVSPALQPPQLPPTQLPPAADIGHTISHPPSYQQSQSHASA